jgi:hypothetical protein
MVPVRTKFCCFHQLCSRLNIQQSIQQLHKQNKKSFANLQYASYKVRPLFYSFVRDLPEDGYVEAETCRRHILKWQTFGCFWLCNCWIKCCVIIPGFVTSGKLVHKVQCGTDTQTHKHVSTQAQHANFISLLFHFCNSTVAANGSYEVLTCASDWLPYKISHCG